MRKTILTALLLSLIMASCKKPGGGTSNGSFSTLYNFTSATGENPYGELIISGSTLYGMTSAGGLYNGGTIFSININGSGYTDMHDFGGTGDGEDPMGDLTLSGNTLYGMTHQGGANSEGVLFSISTAGGGYKVLYNFGGGSSSASGVYPNGSLTLFGNLLYGMTSEGGVPGNGNIFTFNISDSTYTDVYDFPISGHNGVTPGGNLIVFQNMLYGMAYLGGGSANDGVVFSVSTNGLGYTNIVTFTGTNGANPQGSLLLSNGTLYGTTNSGGANGAGNIFSVSTNGSSFKDLYDFNGTTGASSPFCTLIISASTLYGTAPGGADVGGYVYSISSTGGSPTNLYSFDLGGNGSSPHGGLLLSNGVLYGMTYAGGKNSYGTIYSLPQ